MVQVRSLNQSNPVSVSVNTGTTDHDKLANRDLLNQHPISAITGLRGILNEHELDINTHIADKNNPHEVTKSQVGLGNVDNTSDVNKPISTATQSALDLKVNTADLGNAELDIQKNGTSVGKFTANASTDKVINIVVPTKASDINALPDSTKYGASLSLSINSSTFVVTAQLKDQDGGNLGSAQTIDLPLESVVVNGTYDSINKKIVLTLENGNTVDIPVGDLIAGLQSEITVDNKLSADLVDDSSANHKFVTASEKSQITTNANNIVDLQNNKASTSLDNLSADGQMVIDTVDGKISNCVLDIPQNIKLELSNNVLTLKSGSILTRDETTYSTITTTQDISINLSTVINTRNLIFFSKSDTPYARSYIINNICSGATDELAGTSWHAWFDTETKQIKTFGSDGTVAVRMCYPVCVYDVDSQGNITFAKDSNGNDMVFNGMGFIGHHIFIYPNINAYIPAALNPDGSLASTQVNTNALRIIEALSGYGYDSLKRWISLQSNHTVSNWSAYIEVNHDSEADYSIANVRYYARDINLIKRYNSGSISAVDGVPLVEYYYDGSNITSFTPKQCVRLATVDMLDKIQDQVDTNTVAIDGKQDTLVSGTNIKTINNTTVLGSGNFALADQSLSNLNSNGQMIIDSQNGTISNCVLDIPQNIKMEISGSNVIVKAGSIGVRPGSTYQTYTLNSDYSYDYSSTSDGTYVFMIRVYSGGPTNIGQSINVTVSGATDSLAGTGYHTWFDTTNLQIKRYDSDPNNPDTASLYPFAIIEVKNGVPSFAKDSNGNDMIFNGAGFIGHHAFVYPNVKFLRPNEFNAQGKLNSNKVTLTSLLIYEMKSNVNSITLNGTSSGSTRQYYEVDNLDVSLQGLQYVKSENVDYFWNGAEYVKRYETKVIDFNITDTTVTDFVIRQPVRTATVEMVDKKQADLTTVSGYDATATQVLKNINGVLTWVTEE